MRTTRRCGAVVLVAVAWAFAPRARADDAPVSPDTPAGAPAPAAPTAEALAASRKLVEEGDVAREEGKYVDAVKAYGKALNLDESNWVAHVRYQEMAIAAGAAAGLRDEYEESCQQHPKDPLLRLHRLRLDPPASRIDALNALLKADPKRREVLVELGRAMLATGDEDGASKALEAAWAIRQDADEVLRLSAEALRRAGDAAGARTRLEGATKTTPDLYEAILDLARLDLLEGKAADAKTRAERVLELRPSYLAALLVRSEASLLAGKVEDARASLDTALRIQPDDPDALVAAADLTAKGANADGLKKALELYKKAAAAKGVSQLRVLYGQGWAQERIPALPDAADSYKNAGLLAPSDSGIMNSVGVVLLKQKKFADAIAQFKRAIDADPIGAEAYANMAAVYDEQADWNEAIKWYRKLLAMKGQDKNVRALLCCAFDYEATTSYKEAEALLEKVLVLRPDDSEVHTFYGDNQYFQHKWKNAIKAYQDGTKLDEKNRFAWRGLGLALVEDDRPQDAVTALEKARALKADDPPTLIALGDLYAGKDVHDLAKAIAAYEGYVKAGGSDTDVPGLIEELKKELEAEKKSGGK